MLKAQLKRAVRLSSDAVTRERSIKKVSDLFLTNGYPARLVRSSAAHVISDAQHPPNPSQSDQHRRRRSDNTFISPPYIDGSLAHKVQGIIRTSGLPLVTWRKEQSLKSVWSAQLWTRPPAPRGGRKCATCMNELDGRCHTTNMVCEIVCELCEENKTRNAYIGETKRNVRLRFNEHLINQSMPPGQTL